MIKHSRYKKMKQSRFKQLMAKVRQTRVLVIGDLMLDEYIWGKVSRISPEAPIPIVHMHSEDAKPGGAANVANNIVSLGGQALLAGVIGNDNAGKKLLTDLRRLGIDTQGVVTDPHRPTIVKTRVIAHSRHQSQQMVRIDREKPGALPERERVDMLKRIETEARQSDAIVLSDYGKGVFSPNFTRRIIAIARKHGLFITADPKPHNFSCFKGVDLVSPNQMEAEQASGLKIMDRESLARAGKIILKKYKCRSLLITRGEEGMVLFSQAGGMDPFPAMAREVYDVTGAGDTVIATLTLLRAAGASLREAVDLANHAAGVVVAEMGAATVTSAQLEEVMFHAG